MLSDSIQNAYNLLAAYIDTYAPKAGVGTVAADEWEDAIQQIQAAVSPINLPYEPNYKALAASLANTWTQTDALPAHEAMDIPSLLHALQAWEQMLVAIDSSMLVHNPLMMTTTFARGDRIVDHVVVSHEEQPKTLAGLAPGQGTAMAIGGGVGALVVGGVVGLATGSVGYGVGAAVAGAAAGAGAGYVLLKPKEPEKR